MERIAEKLSLDYQKDGGARTGKVSKMGVSGAYAREGRRGHRRPQVPDARPRLDAPEGAGRHRAEAGRVSSRSGARRRQSSGTTIAPGALVEPLHRRVDRLQGRVAGRRSPDCAPARRRFAEGPATIRALGATAQRVGPQADLHAGAVEREQHAPHLCGDPFVGVGHFRFRARSLRPAPGHGRILLAHVNAAASYRGRPTAPLSGRTSLRGPGAAPGPHPGGGSTTGRP